MAASNEKEKERWLEDLNMAIAQADADPKMPYLNLKSCSKCFPLACSMHDASSTIVLARIARFCRLGRRDGRGHRVGGRPSELRRCESFSTKQHDRARLLASEHEHKLRRSAAGVSSKSSGILRNVIENKKARVYVSFVSFVLEPT